MAHLPTSGALVLALFAFAACQGETRPPPTAPVPSEPTRSAKETPKPAMDTAAAVSERKPVLPPVTEVDARSLLAARFRAAGFRIVHDVPLTAAGASLTVDGYDPAKKVGFEYVAPEERDTDLTRAEQTALGGQSEHKLLVIDATDAASLAEQTTKFLATLEANSGSDPK